MTEQLYTRQQELQLSIPSIITIAGAGGIGFWVAVDSAVAGIPNIYIFDDDVLEESNRNRLPVCQGSLNKPKVEVVRDYILALRPDCVVVAVQERLQGILLEVQLGVSEYIIECTDSSRSQIEIYNACKRAGVNFIRAGYDGTHITVTSVVSGWVRGDEEDNDYTIRPSWVVTAQVVAALTVAKMMKYPNQEVSLDISEIGIPVLQRKSRLTARCNQMGTSNIPVDTRNRYFRRRRR